ncbi:hypothetical protein A2768_00770 [Candidatus Roizmanbacteria bacterium RIFCSPHIGHO2_01_FULL_37_16]|nr:MAG: hypothetical protein A2768_00770 [Candidatus Roizmanbacteria bacterium RIFCSPHIGHO2_01_FULL_37_16]
MGKIFFTQKQKFIFDQVKNEDFFKSDFYFTGGTALSFFYLQHRYSEDLDFFSERKFSFAKTLELVRSWANKYSFTFTEQVSEVVHIFIIKFKNGESLKVDFGYYPYKRVENGISYENFAVDSLLDIAINKLSTINQRSQVKDFVDLYFVLDKFTIWDLIEGVRVKFKQELEPLVLGGDLIYIVDQFTELPRMIKPLMLEELKIFFHKKALELGFKKVEK